MQKGNQWEKESTVQAKIIFRKPLITPKNSGTWKKMYFKICFPSFKINRSFPLIKLLKPEGKKREHRHSNSVRLLGNKIIHTKYCFPNKHKWKNCENPLWDRKITRSDSYRQALTGMRKITDAVVNGLGNTARVPSKQSLLIT